MTRPRAPGLVALTFAAVAATALAALGVQYRSALDAERAAVTLRLASFTDEQVLLVRGRLDDARADLHTCLDSSRGGAPTLAACRPLVRRTGYEWILYADRAGRRAAAIYRDGAPPPDPDPALLAAARASVEPVVAAAPDAAGGIRAVDLALADRRGRDAAGTMVLRLDASAIFGPLESAHPMSATAESLIARRDGDRVVFLSRLKGPPAAATASASDPRLASARALRGETFDGSEVDYRGEPIVAVARRILGTDWVLIAKVDAAEVAGPIRARMASEAALLLGVLLAAAVSFGRLLRRQEAVHEERRRGAETALREKTRLLDLFMEHSLTPIVLLDPQLRFLRVNEAYAKACGKRVADFPGRGHFELYPHPENEAIFREVVRTKVSYRAVAKPFEFADHPEWGTTFWDWVLVPLVGEDGEVESLVFSLEDVTERSRAERELRRHSDELDDLYNRAPCGYHSLGPDGTFLRINDTELSWIGYSRDEVVDKKKFSDLVTPLSQKLFREEFPAFKERGWVKGLEFDMVRKDGSVLPVLVSATAVKDEGGRYLMSRFTVFDNTERRSAEEARRHLAAMVEGSADAIIGETFDGVITSWNDGARRLYGWTADEVVGEPAAIVVPEAGRAEFAQIRALVRRGERVAHREVDRVRKDGGTVRVSLSVSPVKGPDGAIVGVSVVARDVTERWKAEQEVARLTRAMKTLSQCNEALVRAKDEGELLDRVCRLIVEQGGYRFAWVGERVDDAEKSVRPRAQAGYEQGYLDKIRVTWADAERGRGPTGTAIREGTIQVSRDFETDPRMAPWREEALKRGYRGSIALPLAANGHARGALMIYATEAGAFGAEEVALLRELSEDLAFGLAALRARAARDAAEAALREREADLNRAQAVGHIGSWVLDVPKNELLWSAETHRIFAVPPGTPLTYELFLAKVHPDDRAAVDAAWRAALARRPYDVEHRILVDGVQRWVRERAEIEFAPDGAPLRGIGTVQDITDLKTAAIEREQFHRFFMTSADLMCIADPQGAFVKTNPSFTETLGYTEDELVAEPFVDFIHPDDKQATVDEMARQMKSGSSLNFENRYRCRDGSYKWLSWRAIFNKAEGLTYATARDVTERKRAEEALRRKSRALRTLSLCNESLVRAKGEDDLLERICRIVVQEGGYPLAWVGFRVDDADKSVRPVAWSGAEDGYIAKARITWADSPRGRGPAGTAIRTGAVAITTDFASDPQMLPWREDALARGYRSAIGLPLTANGAPFGALIIYAPVPDAFNDDEIALLKELSEDLAFGVASLRTRAARELAEGALRAAGAYNRSLIEASLDPLVTIGPDGRITDVNRATEAATGRSRAELIGTDFSVYFTKPEQARAGYERAFRDGEVRDYPLELRASDGRVVPVLYNATVYRDDAGEVVGVFAAARDMTEAARAQDALRAAGVYNRSLIEASLDPLVTIGPDGRITDVNRATEAATGRSRAELIGTDFTSYFTKPEQARAGYERVFREGQVRDYPLELRARDGGIVPVLYNATVYRDAAGEVVGVFAAARDMTEVERSQAALRALEEKYRLIVENSRDLIALVDPAGRCLYASPSHRAILGYGPEELEGRDIFALLPKERAAEMRAVFAASQASSAPTLLEAELLHKNGETRSFEVSGLWMRDAAGAPTQGMLVSRDVTERKRLQSERQHAQRMESVGVLAGGVAHDFNNILMTILANCSFLMTSLAANDPRRADVEEIKAAGERAAALTRQLLIFSRKQKTQPIVLDLNASVTNLLKMLRRLIGEDIKIEAALAREPVMALVDPGQIEQVITNLAVNARDAMPEGGKLVLRTEVLPASAAHAPACAAGADGRRARLTVEDTGTGMPPTVVAHLFEPFFTTKPVGKGTGLGLSTVYGIVRGAKGDVAVRSAPGAGTVFTIDLPLAGDGAAPSAAAAAPKAAERGGETILIVEDDETLRRIDARVLKERGYRVLAARDGEEALKLLHDGAKDAVLMVTDVVMPGIGGGELARQAVAFKPALKVMFVSGYVEHGALERLAGTRYEFLQKPFAPEVLAAKVREVLDRKDAPPPAGAV